MPHTEKLSWKDLAIFTGVAFIVRAVVAWGVCAMVPLLSTAAAYVARGAQLVGSFPGIDAHYWPPGLPYLLALVSSFLEPGAGTARLVSVTASTLTAPMVALAAWELFASRRTACRAGWIAALYPPAVMWVGQPNSHHVAGLLMVVVFWGLAVGERTGGGAATVVAALAAGYACITRPAMLMLLPAVALWMLLTSRRSIPLSRRIRRSGIWLLASTPLVVAVMAHNAAFGAGWVVSTNNERNFFLGNNPYTPIYKTSHLAQRPDLSGLDADTAAYLRSVYGADEPRQAMMAEAWRHIRNEPLTAVRRVLARARALWGFDYVASRQLQDVFSLSNAQLATLLMLEGGGYVLVLVLALCGVFIVRRWQPRPTGLLAVLLSAAAAPYLVTFASGTYHFALMGLVIPMAGSGLVAVAERDEDSAATRARSLFFIAIVVFGAIQVEYAYHAVKYALR